MVPSAEWYEKNVDHNRQIRPGVVDAYAKDMADGKWELNGEPIIFNEDGSLHEGQHRLLACMKAGVPFKSLVVWNVKKDTFYTLNSGIKRTIGDHFGFEGEKNAIALAAGLHQILRYEAGIFDKGTSLKATPPVFFDALKRHPDIRESVNYGQMVKKVMRHSLGTALHYLFSQKDAGLADLFFTKLSTGAELKTHDPVYLLRERLQEEQKDKSYKIVPREVLGLAITAWNAVRKNKNLQRLRWNPETFPEIE